MLFVAAAGVVCFNLTVSNLFKLTRMLKLRKRRRRKGRQPVTTAQVQVLQGQNVDWRNQMLYF